MRWHAKNKTLTPRKCISVSVIIRFFSRSRGKAKSQGEETTSTVPSKSPPSESPPDSPSDCTPPPTVIQHERQDYCQLNQRLDPLLPQACKRIEPQDVQLVDDAPFASGGFSEIWRGSFGGLPVVVKVPRLYSSPEFDPAEVGIRFLKEVWASSRLSHPNIVPFVGVYSTPTHPFALLYKMMDNRDIGQYLADHPNVNRLKLLADVARALMHLHGLDIVHGNVKMRNVLVDEDGVARLGGLGSAFSLSLPISWSDIEAGGFFCGTAPELVKPDAFGLVHARATKATDMFSFGMFAWEVLAGKPPFAGKVEPAAIFSIFQNDRPPRPTHPEVSESVWNMIQRCWERSPFQRMTAAEVVQLLEAGV